MQIGRLVEVQELVKRFHYSGRPTIPWCVGSLHIKGGLLGDSGPAVAGMIFSHPPARWAEEVIELTRLVGHPSYDVPLSWFISKMCTHLRAHKSVDLLVSYADSTEGHHGGIYQASSWNFHSRREPTVDGFIIGGEFMPRRTINSVLGSSSIDFLKKRFPGKEIVPHYDKGKFLYWKYLRTSGKYKAQRLGLERNEYPKPDKS